MSTETKENGKVIEVGKVFTRDDDITPPDPAQGDPPLLTADEQVLPVEVELVRPIEVDGVEVKSLVIDPAKMDTGKMMVFQQAKGKPETNVMRWVCECVQLSETDIKKMLPADYRRVATVVGAFT